MQTTNRSTAVTIVPATMLGFQAAIGIVTALALFASAHRWGRFAFGAAIEHRRMALGWLLMALAIAMLVLAIGLASRASWAIVGAIVSEGLVAVGAVARVGIHPFVTLVTLVYAATVVGLLWRSDTNARSGSRANDTPPSGTAATTT